VNWGIALLLFVVGALTDVAWGRWTLTVNRGQVVPSIIWAWIICIPYALTVNAYVRDWQYVLPYATGAAIGTGLTTWHGRRKQGEKDAIPSRATS
jgi:hypothetical protein